MRQTTAGSDKLKNFRMVNVKRIANGRTIQKPRDRGIHKSTERKGYELIILEVTYLGEVNFESRVDAANNNVNLCHNNVI